MNKQVLNQIKNLVKSFNEKNADLFSSHNETPYKVIETNFGRNKYAVKIEYTIFLSFDFEEITKFSKDNGLIMALMTYGDKKTEAYIYIQ